MGKTNLFGDQLDILLVEDDTSDVRIIEDFVSGLPLVKLRVVTNGEEALLFLRGQAPYHNACLPNLILMDLNLPVKDGRELLAEIRADGKFTHLPVVVLTTSDADHDLFQAYRLHASGFVTKPSDLDEFLRVIKGIIDYWSIVSRPPGRIAISRAG